MPPRVNSKRDAVPSEESPVMRLIHSDERLTLELWSMLTGMTTLSSVDRVPPPPGWLIDVNDRVLLTYDPYFGTSERKQDEAQRLLDPTDRYYAKTELPICRTDAFLLRTSPPLGDVVVSSTKGRFVVANQDIKAGEVVAMDTSALTSVADPLVFLYPPPATSTSAGGVTAQGKSVPDGDLKGVYRAARAMIKNAQSIDGFSAALLSTGRLQILCSLLVCNGDVALLPRSTSSLSIDDVRFRRPKAQALCACGATRADMVFSRREVQKSECAERMVKRLLDSWWRVELASASTAMDCATIHSTGDDAPVDPRLLQLSRLAIQCIPQELLEVRRDKDTSCCGTNVTVFGFFARVGLHDPVTLAKFFSVWDANSMSVHIPDLIDRSALFPFLRFFEHECRPNCGVVHLDSPATHTFGEAGRIRYDTKASDADPYESPPDASQSDRVVWWPYDTTSRIFLPSTILITAIRDISRGESLSISYAPTAFMTQPSRVKLLRELYHFDCTCRWCTTEADLARAFRCPKCPPSFGVICPVGDGTKLDLWECLQCGYHPDVAEEIPKFLDEERKLLQVKGDKSTGMVTLLSSPLVHFTHAAVFRKIDQWSAKAWDAQEGQSCIDLIEILQKSVNRLADVCDVARAQYHEFLGQVNHALGNAHTARCEYFYGYQTRVRCGHRLEHWTRKAQFMAAEKSLVDYLDSR